MRIAIFTDYFLPHIGGVETSIFHQQRALKAAGHEVFIISPPMKGAGVIDDQKEHVVRVRSPINIHFDGMGVFVYSRNIYKTLDKLNLEVIHFESEFNMAALAIRYAKSRNLHLLYTAHTFVTPQVEYLMKYPRLMAQLSAVSQKIFLGKLRPKKHYEAIDGLFGIPASTPAEKSILDTWMKLASIPDMILAPSQRMVDYIGHYHPDKPRYLIPNPFESEIMQDVPVKAVHDPIRIISSFVLRPEKRPEVLVEAYHLLSPDEQALLRIDMYGGGLLLSKMRRTVKDHKLEDKITIHGSVPTEELHKAKTNSDVMVGTSYGFDNQPMMFLEALAAGCAILFCDEYLRESTSAGNSILVEPSPEGFANGLRQIIKDPHHLLAMKKASRSEAKNFNYQTFASKYNKMLDDLPTGKK
jgi:glycosyltransferase involved in cell wall biosynthesis